LFNFSVICIQATINNFLILLGGYDYPNSQQGVILFLSGGSTDRIVNLTIIDDNIVECNETFSLELVLFSGNLLQIDPARNQTHVTIIDDDGLLF